MGREVNAMRRCRTCGISNPPGMDNCYACLRALTRRPGDPFVSMTKICRACEARHLDQRTLCYVCGNPLDQQEGVSAAAPPEVSVTQGDGDTTSCSLAAPAPGSATAPTGEQVESGSEPAWVPGDPSGWQATTARLRSAGRGEADALGASTPWVHAWQGARRLLAKLGAARPAVPQ